MVTKKKRIKGRTAKKVSIKTATVWDRQLMDQITTALVSIGYFWKLNNISFTSGDLDNVARTIIRTTFKVPKNRKTDLPSFDRQRIYHNFPDVFPRKGKK